MVKDMHNFNKLPDEQKLAVVKKLILSFPAEKREQMVRDLIVRKEDQDKMIKEINDVSQ